MLRFCSFVSIAGLVLLTACFPSLPPEKPDADTGGQDTSAAADTEPHPDTAAECADPDDCSHLAAACARVVCLGGGCATQPLNGTACDDGDPCTKDDTCDGYVCAGTVYTCDDGEVCTDDVCDGEGGCSYPVRAQHCFINRTCYVEGQLRPDDPCRVCEGGQSWAHNDGAVCDDGLACTEGDQCVAGTCSGAAVSCTPPGVPCAEVACEESAGGCVTTFDACDCEEHADCGPQGRCDDFACTCVPACDGKACGPDGCGGDCGTCEAGFACNSTGTCVCQPDCVGKQCGENGCGGQCGVCPAGLVCDDADQCNPLTCPEHDVPCPVLSGYEVSCNTRERCEYRRLSPTAGWHADEVWIWVEVGSSFVMGSPDGMGYSDSKPRHLVTFGHGFFFQKYPVTTRMYEACEGAGGCTAPTLSGGVAWGVNRSSDGRAQHPQNALSWSQSKAVCEWLGGRQVNESEWEYAAGGPVYPWGVTEPTCDNDRAVFNDGSGPGCGTGGTWPVGAKTAGVSRIGALDMAGNVYEWVEDCLYSYTADPHDGSTRGAVPCDSYLLARGGGASATPAGLTVFSRGGYSGGEILTFAGARCVKLQ